MGECFPVLRKWELGEPTAPWGKPSSRGQDRAQPDSAHLGSRASKQVMLNQGNKCQERKRKLAMSSEKLWWGNEDREQRKSRRYSPGVKSSTTQRRAGGRLEGSEGMLLVAAATVAAAVVT